MATNTTTGREYLRVSLDRSGRARSLDEQHDENERAATTRGVALGTPYKDKSISASRYTSKARDDFDRLLVDLDKGKFGANELWLWEPSRGSRRVSEWVLLIEACEKAGVAIFVTTHQRTYDPSNPRDRRSLLEDAVDSEYESSKVSDRGKRAAAANAAAGLPHGRTPYGYVRIYDTQTRRLMRQEPHPEEAPVVREIFARLQQGHSLRAIAMDLDARGVRTRTMKPITARHLRDIAMNPTYAGLRVHTPRGRNGERGPRHGLDGKVKGTWEGLVSEEAYYAVRHTLTRPERKTTRPGRARHLLSFIAVCEVCGGPLVVSYRSDGKVRQPDATSRVGVPGHPTYQCQKGGHVRISQPDLDELATDVLLTFLAREDAYEGITSAEQDDADLQVVRNNLAVARGELDDLRAGVAAGRLVVANLTAVEPGLVARVETLEAQERDLSTPSTLRGLFEPGPGAAKRWEAAEPSTRREVARALLTPEVLGQLRVRRRPRDAGPRHIPADERTEFWKPRSPA